jgi:hypothetical protein
MGPCHTVECLATIHPNREVRLAALKKIINDSKLLSIAECDKDYEIKGEAIQRIKDHSILKDLAIYSREKQIRRLAAEKLVSSGEATLIYYPKIIKFIKLVKRIRRLL